jgi:ketosteroid isomerase-like protein
MRHLPRIIILLVLAGFLGGSLWLLFPSEERKIRKQLHQLAGRATFTGEEGNIRRIANASAAANQFALDAHIAIHVPGFGTRTLHGRADIHEAALAAMTQVRTPLEVEFHDIVVQVAPDKTTAVADLTATVRFGNEQQFGLQELRFHMRKGDSGWLIERLETLATFR